MQRTVRNYFNGPLIPIGLQIGRIPLRNILKCSVSLRMSHVSFNVKQPKCFRQGLKKAGWLLLGDRTQEAHHGGAGRLCVRTEPIKTVWTKH